VALWARTLFVSWIFYYIFSSYFWLAITLSFMRRMSRSASFSSSRFTSRARFGFLNDLKDAYSSSSSSSTGIWGAFLGTCGTIPTGFAYSISVGLAWFWISYWRGDIFFLSNLNGSFEPEFFYFPSGFSLLLLVFRWPHFYLSCDRLELPILAVLMTER
jgi:hypothetical protein